MLDYLEGTYLSKYTYYIYDIKFENNSNVKHVRINVFSIGP